MRTGPAPFAAVSRTHRPWRHPAGIVAAVAILGRDRSGAALPRRSTRARPAPDRSRAHGDSPSGRHHLHTALAWSLFAATAALAGCSHRDAIATPPAALTHADPPAMQRARLPEELGGVWYVDDPAGHAQCARYRAASPHWGDEESIAMVGSLVVTPDLIHEYAEYGEGNFFAVRSVTRRDSAWRIDVAIGTDTIPRGGPDDALDVYRLELDQDRLYWEPWDTAAKGLAYFRCDAVRRGAGNRAS